MPTCTWRWRVCVRATRVLCCCGCSANLTASDSALDTLDDTLQDSVGRVETANNQIDVVKVRVDEVKQKAAELRSNATGVKALDPAGQTLRRSQHFFDLTS